MKLALTLVIALFGITLSSAQETVNIPQYDHYPFHNKSYIVYRATEPVVIDGNIYTDEWNRAAWTDNFIDIEGERRPIEPAYPARAKLMWDDTHLYIAAEMVEPHIWATKTRRDDVIYFDNDIEVFIDVSSQGHHYYEFEFNALGTEWDLLLTQPYFRGGTFFNGWDLKGMKTAVTLYGSVNNPNDKDDKWTIEIAMPLSELVAVQYGKSSVKAGEQWRINFSRVEWLKFDVIEGQYKKKPGTETFGNEDNWVWCPTGVIDMHRPERWGYMQFSDIPVGRGCDKFNWDNGHQYKEQLWIAAERIAQFRNANDGAYPTHVSQLKMDGNLHYYPAGNGYKLTIETPTGQWFKLSEDGRIQGGN